MKNIQTLKSFHERALDEWNSAALVMKEAISGEKDTHRAFVEILLTLADMAGKDKQKRQNLLRAGDVILHSIAADSTPKMSPTALSELAEKSDRWKRIALIILACLLCVGSFAGGFALNTPKVVSSLPSTSTSATPSNTPEELLQQLVEAIPRKDWQRILGLYHPIIRKDLRANSIESQIADIDRAFKQGVMPQLRIEGIEYDLRAKLFTTIIVNQQQIAKKTINLKQFENVWYIERIDY